jgi:TRAP-type C4-dicarboxylate transport system substrate-binding protein
MLRGFFAVAMGAGIALAGSQSAAQDFVYGSWIPEAEYTNRVALPKAFEEIAAETDVNWRLVPGGQLVNPVDTWDAVEAGLVQGGMGIASYVPSVVPTINVIYQTVLPGTETLAAGGAALETLMLDCPACMQELKDLNMVSLAGWDTSPYYLGCTQPVDSVDDMAGLKIRATGGNVRLMEAGGATPVAATLVEAINLLQTGAIDCIFGVPNWYRSFGYADFITHHTDYPMGMTGPATGWLMNRDAWLSLDEEEQRLHMEKGAMVSAMQALGQFVQEADEVLAWAVSDKGVEIVDAEGEGFAQLMEEFVAAQDQAVIEAATGQGVENPEEIIATYRENFEKWKGLTEGVETIEGLTQLYWDEVFSEVDLSSL